MAKIKGGSKKRAGKLVEKSVFKELYGTCDLDIEDAGEWQFVTPSNTFNIETSPNDLGVKNDSEKPMMQLLDPRFQEEVAKVFTFGASKYGTHNYKKGLKISRVLGALDRHLGAFKIGEDLDKETNLSHLAHAACCLQMAYYMVTRNNQFDDRQENFN